MLRPRGVIIISPIEGVKLLLDLILRMLAIKTNEHIEHNRLNGLNPS